MSQNRKVDAVIYIGNYQFPMGDAVAKRALGLGKAFSYAGYRVLFIDENASVPLGEISEVKCYGKFEYCSIHHSTSSIEHYLYKKDLSAIKKRIMSWCSQYHVIAIILCGTKCALLANGIVSYAKKTKIPVIADSMDWLTSHTGNFIFDLLKQLDTTFEIKVVNQRADGIICISEYLSSYYRTKQKRTLVIPPLSPYERPKYVETKTEKIKLIYAGVPCRLGRKLKRPSDAKDRLDLAIQMLSELSDEGCDFEFDVYGLKKEDYDTVFPEQKEVTDSLVAKRKLCFKNRQNENIVREAVVNSDFIILLREKNRTSMAGFPTKISESIFLGTPVITTDTTDIKKYVREGETGFYLNLNDWEESKEKLKKILYMNAYDRNKLKKETFKNECFSPQSYSKLLKEFLAGFKQTGEER